MIPGEGDDDDMIGWDDEVASGEADDDDGDAYREYWMFNRGPELRHYWDSRTRTLGEISLGLGALAASIDSKPSPERAQVADVLFALAGALSRGHWDALRADSIHDRKLLKALHAPAARHLRETGQVPTTLAELGRRLCVELVLFLLHETGRQNGASRRDLWATDDPAAELSDLVEKIRRCRSYDEIVALAQHVAGLRRSSDAGIGSDNRLAGLFFAWCDTHGVYRPDARTYFGQWLFQKGARFSLFTESSAAEIAQRLETILADTSTTSPGDPDAIADLAQRVLRAAGLAPKAARNIIHAADDMREKRQARRGHRPG